MFSMFSESYVHSNRTWNIHFQKSDIILYLSPIGQNLMHSFNSRIGPSIIWKLVKTEPCMTSSFHETKTWDRTCKHHYNDILTNMQTIIHKSSERRRKHDADCTAHCCVLLKGWGPSLWEPPPLPELTDWLTDCVSPLAGCWLSYFKWHSRAELSWALLLTDCSPLSGLSLPAACVASCGSTILRPHQLSQTAEL